MTTKRTAEQTSALDKLAGILPKGTMVYTNLRHVSQSGLQRAISVHVIRTWDDTPEISDISHLVALAGLYKRHPKHDRLKVNGAGMDMGYDVVDTISRALHSDGYALKHRWI